MASPARAIPTMVVLGEKTDLFVGIEVGLFSDEKRSLRYKVVKMNANEGITVERENGIGKSRVSGLKPSQIDRLGF